MGRNGRYKRVVRQWSYINYEDTTCEVACCCGAFPWVTASKITWCKCGRGFKSEFKVHSFKNKSSCFLKSVV
jgi:hypothetical protein